MTVAPAPEWVTVCEYDELPVEYASAALLGAVQVALIRTFTGTVYAVGNIDPFSNAAVISRGIVGTRGDRDTIASPIYKQVFDLETGRCLDVPEVALATYPVRLFNGRVEVSVG